MVPLLHDFSDRCEAAVGLYGNRRDPMVTGKKVHLGLPGTRVFRRRRDDERTLGRFAQEKLRERRKWALPSGLCMILRQEPELPLTTL